MTENERITQRVRDFNDVFGSQQGKRVLMHLERFCLKNGCTYVPDSDKSIFNQGARAVILEIDHWIDYDLSKLEKTGETINKEPLNERK